jgi:hypothetical protein
MIRFVMLLAVADIGNAPSLLVLGSEELEGNTSSTGSPLAAAARAAELAFPKLNTHFDRFFVAGTGGAGGDGRGDGNGGTGGHRFAGMVYIDTGSKR